MSIGWWHSSCYMCGEYMIEQNPIVKERVEKTEMFRIACPASADTSWPAIIKEMEKDIEKRLDKALEQTSFNNEQV